MCWYSLDSFRGVLSDEYPCSRVTVIIQLFCILLYGPNSPPTALGLNVKQWNNQPQCSTDILSLISLTYHKYQLTLRSSIYKEKLVAHLLRCISYKPCLFLGFQTADLRRFHTIHHRHQLHFLQAETKKNILVTRSTKIIGQHRICS